MTLPLLTMKAHFLIAPDLRDLDKLGDTERKRIWEVFEKDRRKLLGELSGPLNAEIDDGALVRKKVTREEIAELYESVHRGAEKYKTVEVDFTLGVDYTAAELFASRYIRMAVAGVPGQMGGYAVDETRDGGTLNSYTRVECPGCGWPDLSSLNDPFLVTPKIAPRLETKKYFIYPASNGIHVISTALWRDMPQPVRECLDAGRVAFFDAPQTPVEALRWIRPRFQIGPLYNRKVLETCAACGRPTEIRALRDKRYFIQNLMFLEGMDQEYPMALVGNWYGHVFPAKPFSVHWNVAISGATAKIFKKMKVFHFLMNTEKYHDMADFPEASEIADRFTKN